MTLQPYQPGAITFGSQSLDAGDFIPPRVKVVQAMSAEREAGIAEGSLYNTLTSEDYGASLRIVPIQAFKNRILLVRQERREAMDAALAGAGLPILPPGDGLMCRSLDMLQGVGDPGIECHACPLAEWRDNQPPLCSETYNVAALTELGDLVIVGFSKSSARVGKRMFSMLRLSIGAPWNHVYEVTTLAERNDRGRFYIPQVRKADVATDELRRMAMTMAQQLQGVTIDATGSEEEARPLDQEAPWEKD